MILIWWLPCRSPQKYVNLNSKLFQLHYLDYFISVEFLFQIQGPPNTFFYLESVKKTAAEYFLHFFLLKVQSFWLIMANNFIPMASSAGHAVAYTISPIFKHIIDCVQLNEYFPLKRQFSLACRRNSYL